MKVRAKGDVVEWCGSDKHRGKKVQASRICKGESWQDQLLYLCLGCAREHETTTHHRTVGFRNESSHEKAE